MCWYRLSTESHLGVCVGVGNGLCIESLKPVCVSVWCYRLFIESN